MPSQIPCSRTGWWSASAACLALAAISAAPASAAPRPQEPAQDPQEEIRKIRQEMAEMRADYERRLRELELRLAEPPGDPSAEEPDPLGQDSGLEDALAELEEALAQSSDQQRTVLGQVQRFDNTFNPAISVVLDFSGSATTFDQNFADYDQFRLRAGEIGIAGQVDPYLNAYGIFEFEEEGAGIAELAGVFSLDRFFEGSNARIKGGRFFLDLDPLNRVHEHEYDFVHQPAVKVEMFGGNAVGNGVEFHDWFAIADETPLRFSFGLISSLEGDSHVENSPGHEHGAEEPDPFGRRGFQDLAYTGRVALTLPLDELDTLTIGTSVLYAPRLREFELEPGPPEEVVAHDTRKLVSSVDFKLQTLRDDGTGTTVGGALFAHHGRFTDEASGSRFDEVAYGGYAWIENRFDVEWGTGVEIDWTQGVQDAERELFQASAFLTWYASPLNRLRVQYQFTAEDDVEGARFGQDFHTVFVQWTLALGAHSHGLDW